MKVLKVNALKILIIIFIFLGFGITKVYSQFVEAVVALTGSVINEVNKEPVSVFLVFYDENGKRVNAARSNAAENGYYYVTGLKPGKKYTVEIKQKNYLKENISIEIPNTDRYQEISRDFLVKPLEKNVKIRIPVPPFELNKSKLRYGSDYVLNDYVNVLMNNPGV
ncbi:MAG: OmpA-like protein, partial [Bacteroidota bacterium]|nr:OmpA-like protein [Bacteroidota bacterium]